MYHDTQGREIEDLEMDNIRRDAHERTPHILAVNLEESDQALHWLCRHGAKVFYLSRLPQVCLVELPGDASYDLVGYGNDTLEATIGMNDDFEQYCVAQVHLDVRRSTLTVEEYSDKQSPQR